MHKDRQNTARESPVKVKVRERREPTARRDTREADARQWNWYRHENGSICKM